jgi:hypothetical protein
MADSPKNPDRDDRHARRRGGENSDLDGREAASLLYGGPSLDDTPRCPNCGKRATNNADIGCTKCDPRARRAGRAGPVPTPTTDTDSDTNDDSTDAPSE